MNFFDINNKEINYGDDNIANNLPLVSFNGLNLTECNDIALIEGDNALDLANVDLDTFSSPRFDGGGVIFHTVGERNLRLVLRVEKETQELYERELDRLKERLTDTEGTLIYYMGGEHRQGKASITRFTERQDTKNVVNRGIFDLEFVLLQDWESYETTSITYPGITGIFQTAITNEGSKLTYPTIYFIFNTAGGVSETTVTIGGFTYTIPQTILDGDVLALYGEHPEEIKQQTTYYNTVTRINTNGRYPSLDKGASNIINIGFNGSPNVDITFVYRKTYY